MRIHFRTPGRVVVFVLVTAMLSSCELPRSGPSRQELLRSSVERAGDAFIVHVDSEVTRETAVTPALGLSAAFLNAPEIGSDIIRPGDTLAIEVWENVDNGILGKAGTGTPITEIQVDGAGYIFVPYAGRIRASGNTPDQLRKIITDRLSPQTPDPQVMVQRKAGDGSTVSIVGGVGAQGVYPIERPTRTLTAMLAKAGGVTISPEITQVTITRGTQQAKVWLQDLYKNPRDDIALRPGDRILVQEDPRSFTALGATTGQQRVTFKSQNISALEAIAQVGGLNTAAADPKGVFVLRNEPEEIARIVLHRNDIVGTQRIIYVLDLTKPDGMFNARDFLIRDQDTVYVTEAPYVRFNKTVAAIFGALNSAASAKNVAQSF